ncbi:hypothetical protein [Streptomyces sp. MJP52]|uniref:hypothetical protein n=1 Tax=Streptomyces sp. MJP52 TaxID=2940555 RepID=UPI0024751562|nr:hypothetical protein [Streptomyces sp. MJP52]MDH6223673.1 hypothetical protein [Streptomyces sp. MJP52]
MTRAAEELAIHQLLGRLVYFHVHFIEPSEPGVATTDRTTSEQAARPLPGPLCCRHASAPRSHQPTAPLGPSAWTALIEVAETLTDHYRPCPAEENCCATCRIVAAAHATGSRWAQTECHRYGPAGRASQLPSVCGQAAAVRIGRAFTRSHGAVTHCSGLGRHTSPPQELLPSTEELPLTGELLALWADPAATTRAPVVSWLNHCTGLDDVRRVLRTRRTRT